MDLQNFWDVYSNLVLTLGTNILLAFSIWLTLDCGMLAVANAAFLGIGAYTSSLLTMNAGTPFFVSLAGGMALPAVIAVIIGLPLIRLSGVYLAIATLAFGEVVRVVILNTDSLTGGAMGLNGIPQLTQGWHVLLSVLVVLFILWRVRASKVGRAFDAIRGDETAAGLMGINVRTTKMLAFVGGAIIAGLAGGLNAHLNFFIGPTEYGFDRGVEILTMAILGGIGGLTGPILGALIISLLPQALGALGDYKLIVNGLILVLIVLFLPQGIWDPARFKRWLRKVPHAAPSGLAAAQGGSPALGRPGGQPHADKDDDHA